MDESTQKPNKIRLFYDWLLQKYDHRLADNQRTETVERDGEVFEYREMALDVRLEARIVIGQQRAQEIVRYGSPNYRQRLFWADGKRNCRDFPFLTCCCQLALLILSF
jgi:hypothetical protein